MHIECDAQALAFVQALAKEGIRRTFLDFVSFSCGILIGEVIKTSVNAHPTLVLGLVKSQIQREKNMSTNIKNTKSRGSLGIFNSP